MTEGNMGVIRSPEEVAILTAERYAQVAEELNRRVKVPFIRDPNQDPKQLFSDRREFLYATFAASFEDPFFGTDGRDCSLKTLVSLFAIFTPNPKPLEAFLEETFVQMRWQNVERNCRLPPNFRAPADQAITELSSYGPSNFPNTFSFLMASALDYAVRESPENLPALRHIFETTQGYSGNVNGQILKSLEDLRMKGYTIVFRTRWNHYATHVDLVESIDLEKRVVAFVNDGKIGFNELTRALNPFYPLLLIPPLKAAGKDEEEMRALERLCPYRP